MFDGKLENAVREFVSAVAECSGTVSVKAWPKLLKSKEAAAYLGISLTSFKSLRANPDIKEITPVFPIPGCPRFLIDDLDDFIERRKGGR